MNDIKMENKKTIDEMMKKIGGGNKKDSVYIGAVI